MIQEKNKKDIKDFEGVIQETFGKKIERKNYEHASEIEEILKKTMKNYPSIFERKVNSLVKKLN